MKAGETAIDWYSRGWDAFRTQPLTLIAGFIILALLAGGIETLNEALRIDGLARSLMNLVIGPPVFIGWAMLSLRAVRGERVRAVSVADGFSHWLDAILGQFIVGLLLLIGLVLLVVPSIFVAIVFCLWPFGVMDRRLSAIEALRYSYRATKGHRVNILVAGLLALGLMILSVLTFGVLMIVVGPWLGTTLAVMYTDISGESSLADGEVEYEVIE